MKRRDFFKNLIGGAAAVAIGPKLMAQIEEQDYTEITPVEAPKPIPKPPHPERVFNKGEGLWIFHEDRLIGWSALHGLALHMYPNYTTFRVPGRPHEWDKFEFAKPTIEFEVDDIHLNNLDDLRIFEGRETVTIVFVVIDHKEGKKIQTVTNGCWKGYTLAAPVGEPIQVPGQFMSIGEAIIEITAL